MYSINTKSYYIRRDINQKLVSYPKSFFLDSIIVEFFSKDKFYSKFSFLCLFLDSYPKISLLKNSSDKKKVGIVNGCRVILTSDLKKKQFLFRLKTDLFTLFQKKKLLDKIPYNSISFDLQPNSIKDLNSLYDQYYDLPNLRVTFNFLTNQRNAAYLHLSGWLN